MQPFFCLPFFQVTAKWPYPQQAQNSPRPISVNFHTACSRGWILAVFERKRTRAKSSIFYIMSFIKFSERKRRVDNFEACASWLFSLIGMSGSLWLKNPACVSVFPLMSVSYYHFWVQHCIMSISLHIIIGSRNEYVFLPVLFNRLHQIMIHQSSTQ